MTLYADLEMGLYRRDAESYNVEIRFTPPEGDADLRMVRGGPSLAHFDMERFQALAVDDQAYGQLLGESLFADPDVKTALAQARSVAQVRNAFLRLRLFIGPSSSELHNLRWETLRDPQDGSPLVTSEQILFSRYLCSFDWRPIRRRPRADLRALVVIANPADIASYEPGGFPLASLDVGSERLRAKSSLGNIPVTELASGGLATLNSLFTHLRDGYDIVYLVCHGTVVKCEPRLWLEKDDGAAAVVSGSELISRLKELPQTPRLVVLASCQSAGSGEGEALAALGPSLAEAGVPAVLGMQGNVTIDTISRFMPVFFQELQRDGQIDRAMAVARGAVRERPDWWMPVLFMRLKSGRIWYAPGIAEERGGLEKWPALISSIRHQQCTPILGPGLTEPFIGSRRDIAQRWAEERNFPMLPHEREDLPQVAQYLAVNQDPNFTRNSLKDWLGEELRRRYKGYLAETPCGVPLDQQIAVVGERCWQDNPTEPHWILANLDLPIYITTDPSNLLVKALSCAGKTPQIEICRWNDDLAEKDPIADQDLNYEPTVKNPLVFHLFGRLEEPDSLVLTEDDYFDYMIGVTKHRKLIPRKVPRALTDSALLFLGFQLDEWNFRVLFRTLMGQEGRKRRKEYAHVAAQIDPEEGRILDAEGARRYLESYFQYGNISIYWGSPEDFLKELQRRLKGGIS